MITGCAVEAHAWSIAPAICTPCPPNSKTEASSEPRFPALATRESQLKAFVTITKMIASHTKPPETPAGASRAYMLKGRTSP